MREACQWYENGEECGKPSVSKMGNGPDAWHLCAEHEDQIIREAKEMIDDPGREEASQE